MADGFELLSTRLITKNIVLGLLVNHRVGKEIDEVKGSARLKTNTTAYLYGLYTTEIS